MRTIILVAALAGCGGDALEAADTDTDTDTPDEGGPLAIVGDYVDSWGVAHAISEATWVQTYPDSTSDTFHVGAHDNAERWVVAQNDDANAFNAGLWSRFDWHEDGAELYFCQSAFDADSEDGAMAAPGADATDLTAGCGGFGWTHLTP